MKTDGLFTTHSYLIPMKMNQPIRLVFFGDVHRDSPNHADAEWKRFLEIAYKAKNAFFLGMGDYLDSTSTSERSCLRATAASYHETLLNDIEQLQAEKIKLLAKELQPLRGRIVGLINGNHFFNFQDGTNSDQKLCGLLSTKYLGVSSFIRLYFAYGTQRHSLDIWAHHGAGGGGRLLGGSINRIDQMREHAQADFYAMGHDHKRSVVPANPRLYLDHSSKSGLKVRSRQQWLLRTGSFLKAYTDGERSYNVDACRGPCSLGHVELEINPIGRHSNFDHFEIRGIA